MRHRGVVRPPQIGLIAEGPLVQVTIVQTQAAVDALKAAGQEPENAAGKMMIDTGAQITAVENDLLEAIGLAPIRLIPVMGVSQRSEDCPVYRAGIVIGFGDGSTNAVELMFESDIVGVRAAPISKGYIGLLGRDFLSNFELHYDGIAGTFDIIVPEPVMRKIRASQPPHHTTRKERRQKERRQKDRRR